MEGCSVDTSHLSIVVTLLEHGALAFCGLLVYVMVTRIGRHRRQPSAAVAWVVLIATLPYVGLPLFILFGTRKYPRRGPMLRLTQSESDTPDGASPSSEMVEAAARSGPAWATQLLAAFEMPPPTAGSVVTFQADGGQSWRALLDLLHGAEESIAVCTYLLGDDEIGVAVLAELERAAARGVRVRLLLDAVGSLRTARSGLRKLRRRGAEVQRFMPLMHNPLRGRTNLRNHRKLAIADGAHLWSGGRNLASEYFVDRPGAPAWVDLSFTARGPLAAQAQEVFDHDWSVASGRGARRGQPLPSLALPAKSQPARLSPSPPPPTREATPGAVSQIIASGPDHVDDTLYSLLVSGAYQARTRIVVATPYFVPDDALLSALCLACRRGVRVTVLMPARSNHRLADLARERSVRQLVQAGGKVLLDAGMLHAKAIVIDDTIGLCGTANLDTRSLLLNFEVMVAFYGRTEIEWLADWIGHQAVAARPADARQPGWWRDVLEGMVRAVGYQL
jgi:cardiolipin synthase